MGIAITSITPHSPASKAKIQEGDLLISINKNVIRDVLDYRFYMMESRVNIEIEREGVIHHFKIRKNEYEELGLEFENYLMDHQHHCTNKCIFCFVDQLPKGMRDTLYFKDDDSRMSFLFGSYVTLTNMNDEDITRIIKMHISPINISVHTTNPELRVKMMKNPRSGEVLSYLSELAAHHITINAQLVICPGYNDGEELKRSLEDLGKLAPDLQSIALVPVGITGHREGLESLRTLTKDEALDCIRLADEFGMEMKEKYGSRIAYCADEMFLAAQLPIPNEAYYEDFSQLDNGVGTSALMKSDFEEMMATLPTSETRETISLVTGEAAKDLLDELIQKAKKKIPNKTIQIFGIPNKTFGGAVNVTGLVCGGDIIDYLQDKDLGDRVIIPSIMLRHEQDCFLDDRTPEDIEKALHCVVQCVEMGGETLAKVIAE